MRRLLKAFKLGRIVVAWIPDSMEDGKITISEIVELGVMIAAFFGVDIDTEGFSLSDFGQ